MLQDLRVERYIFLIWKYSSAGHRVGEKIWFHTCATCKMQTCPFEIPSSGVSTIQAELSSMAADLHPWGRRSWNPLCSERWLHRPGSFQSFRQMWLWTKWIIKLIRQPEFERNKQAECVASRCASGLKHGHVFRLVWVWLRVWTGPSQCVHLVFSPSRSQCPSSSQHRHGISRYAGELKGKCPVKQHDDGAEHPFKDGRCMLQDEALLAEKHTAWKPG